VLYKLEWFKIIKIEGLRYNIFSVLMRVSFDSKKRKLISKRNSQEQEDLVSRKSSFREIDSNPFFVSKN